jgi:voltage-gated potassium channel Kch
MNLHKKFMLAIIIFLVFLSGGTLIYSSIEGWRYIDSTYFIVATVTTIGYGDFVPQTDIGKIFTIFFSFLGISMAFYFFTLFGKYIYKKTFQIELREHHKKLIKHIKLHTHKNYQLKGK